MKKETTIQELKLSDFSKRANAEGYQITYKGQNIGGAGILGKYSGRGKKRIAQIKDYCEMADREIKSIVDGFGDDRFYKAIEKINTPAQDSKEVLQDEYSIVLWEDNVYYRASKNSTWTHTVNNRRIHDKNLIEELNDAENKKYGAGLPRFFPAAPVPIPSDEYIERAVNNYQSLADENKILKEARNVLCQLVKDMADSNKELLDKLNELHHYTDHKVKSYNIKDSMYFSVINIMANGLHNKFKQK